MSEKIKIGERKDLAHNKGISFEMIDRNLSKRALKKAAEEGSLKTGFVVEFKQKIQAFENSCPHLGHPLDLQPGEFFDESMQHLICSSHGALFNPGNGECVSGPCEGKSLTSIEVLDEGGELFYAA